MKKWEYRVEVSKERNGDHDHCETEHLNQLGAQGWELVQIDRLGHEFEHRIFKRPLSKK